MSPPFGALQAADLNDIAATDVWAAGARTLTDLSAEEIFDLPVIDDTYSLAYASSGGSANTFGSSVQVSADVGTGKRLLFVTVNYPEKASVTKVQVEFGDAADGAGSVVAFAHPARLNAAGGFSIPLWVSLADDSALHVRVKDDYAGAYDYALGVHIA